MKKSIYTLVLLAFAISASSQVWLEGFTVHSNPMKAFLAKGSETFVVGDYDPVTVQNKDLFQTFANPQFGGGLNIRYAKNNLIVGMETSYVGYKAATQLLQPTMFRIGPVIEYYFAKAEKKLQPYLGGEFEMNVIKVHYNGELFDVPRISNTYLGFGPRAGLVYMFSPKWALRLGAKYIYVKNTPYLDLSAGIALNLGDF